MNKSELKNQLLAAKRDGASKDDLFKMAEEHYPELRKAPWGGYTDEFDNLDTKHKPLSVRFLTNKVRKLRDYFIENGLVEANPRDLPPDIARQMRVVNRRPNGNWATEDIQKYIDNLPAHRYNYHVSMGDYDYIQRHSHENSNVFRLQMTNDMLQKLKANPAVWRSFMNQHNLSARSSHPVIPGTIGWVRWTGDKSGIHVDEVQTDFGTRPWSAMIEENVQEGMKHGMILRVNPGPPVTYDRAPPISPEEADYFRNRFKAMLPDEHLAAIRDIIWMGKSPAEVLHEGFHQWARESGFAGVPIHVWTPQAKALISDIKPDRQVPGHMNLTYKDIPVKMGFEKGVYGELPTQSNPEHKIAPEPVPGGLWQPSNETFKEKIRKEESPISELIGFIEDLCK